MEVRVLMEKWILLGLFVSENQMDFIGLF